MVVYKCVGGDGTRVGSMVVEVKEIPLCILNLFLFSFCQLKCRLYVYFPWPRWGMSHGIIAIPDVQSAANVYSPYIIWCYLLFTGTRAIRGGSLPVWLSLSCIIFSFSNSWHQCNWISCLYRGSIMYEAEETIFLRFFVF